MRNRSAFHAAKVNRRAALAGFGALSLSAFVKPVAAAIGKRIVVVGAVGRPSGGKITCGERL